MISEPKFRDSCSLHLRVLNDLSHSIPVLDTFLCDDAGQDGVRSVESDEIRRSRADSDELSDCKSTMAGF